MPLPVRGFSFTPSPVPNCPACKPNSGSRFPSLSTEAHSSREGPTLADIVMQSCGFPSRNGRVPGIGDSRKPTGPSNGSDLRV